MLSKPNWATYNEFTNEISGIPTNEDSVVLEFTGLKTGYKNKQVFKPKVGGTISPVLTNIEPDIYIDSVFNQFLSLSDTSSQSNLVAKIEIVSKPSWMDWAYGSSTKDIYLGGSPDYNSIGDTLITIKVIDMTGFEKTKTYPIKVLDVASLSGDTSICDGSETSLAVYYSGSMPWQFQYPDGADTTLISGITERTYNVKVSPKQTTQYRLLAVKNQEYIRIQKDAVSIEVPPHFVSGSSYETIAGELFCIQAVANNPYNSTLEYTLTDAPTWLSLQKGSDKIFGTPTMDDVGIQNFKVTATDPYGNTSTSTNVIEVKELGTLLTVKILNDSICAGEPVEVGLDYHGEHLPWGFQLSSGEQSTSASDLWSKTFKTTLIPNQLGEIFLSSFEFNKHTFNVERLVGKVQVIIPAISSISQKIAYVGMPYQSKVNLNSTCTDNLTFALLSGPGWLTINSKD